MKVHITFKYDKDKDETTINIFDNKSYEQRILDIKIIPGSMTGYSKKKIKNEIYNQFKEYDE